MISRARDDNGTVRTAQGIWEHQLEGGGRPTTGWRCVTEGCPVRLYHRVGVLGERGVVRRRSHFYYPTVTDTAPAQEHAEGCPHDIRRIAGALKDEFGSIVHVQHIDDPNEIHIDLIAPPPEEPDTRNRPADHRARFLAGARRIAAFLDQHGTDPDILARFRLRMNRRTIPWDEFVYGPTAADLARLVAVASRAEPVDHPVFVRAVLVHRVEQGQTNAKRRYTCSYRGTARGERLGRCHFPEQFTAIVGPANRRIDMLIDRLGAWGKPRLPSLDVARRTDFVIDG